MHLVKVISNICYLGFSIKMYLKNQKLIISSSITFKKNTTNAFRNFFFDPNKAGLFADVFF